MENFLQFMVKLEQKVRNLKLKNYQMIELKN